MFLIRFCALLFFQFIFYYSGRSNWEFISKSINFEEKGLPPKRANIFLCFSDFNLCLSFWIRTINGSRKVGPSGMTVNI